MDDPNTRFLFSPLETGNMRRDQVNEQHTAEKITTRENRDLKRGALGGPINEETAKEFVLSLKQTDLDLGECADKN